MATEPVHIPFLYLMKPIRIQVIAAHIAGWVLFQCLPLVFILSLSQNTNIIDVISSYTYWLFCLYFIALFYIHSYLLLPHFKWGWYIPAMILLLASAFYLQPFEKVINHAHAVGFIERRGGFQGHENRGHFQPPPHDMPPKIKPGDNDMQPFERRQPEGMGPGGGGRRPMRLDIISFFLFIITICFSVAIDITRRWRLTEQRAALAEADKANAELSFLKAQINPHFLFNTLNNIYSMVITNHEHTADSLLKLSNILRYVIDESKEDYVSLQSEIDCVTDYIDLQRLRLGKKASLIFSITGNVETKKIAPLILMTFIENVFKYGISNHEEAQLIIRISAEKDRIHFFSQNPLFTIPRKIERTGIGISNTEKRLAHLYPGKHQLQITRQNGLFTVDLALQD